MIDLSPLRTFLKFVSFLGLIATVGMMIALLYKKLKDAYPEKVEKNKWVFVVIAILMSALMVFLFRQFFG